MDYRTVFPGRLLGGVVLLAHRACARLFRFAQKEIRLYIKGAGSLIRVSARQGANRAIRAAIWGDWVFADEPLGRSGSRLASFHDPESGERKSGCDPRNRIMER